MPNKGFDHYFKKFDLWFYEEVGLKFDKGKSEYKTKVGALGSIIFTIIMIAYSLDRLSIMFYRDSFALYEFTEFDHFDATTAVGADLDLTFAFGLHSFPAKSGDQIVDFSDYGTI